MGYVDLHLHLDGAITVDIAKKLADMQGITLPGANDDELIKKIQVPEDCADLNEFLGCFELPVSLLQTKEALTEAVRLVLEDCKAHGCVYAEVRFAPQLHTQKGMSQEEAIQAAIEGLKKTDIKANLILCMMRLEGTEEANKETFELAKKYVVPDGGVVAVDLAGAEALFPTKDYREIFTEVKKAGIPFTIHAGEADGAESVKEAISFGASRIGHGVRSNEDESVVQNIIQKNIPLEMCPTSNRKTHAVDDMSKYPIIDYLEKGVCVTVNTDDPAIEGTTIDKEFEYLREKFGLTDEQEKKILENSVKAAFTTNEVKDEIRKKIFG